MAKTLHTVAKSEWPILKDWLEKHTPDSFLLNNFLRENMHGRWTGTKFCTLGWPDILAVGVGEANPESVCGDYLNSPRTTAVFSPDPDHLKKLLLWPGFFDWDKTIDFQVVSPEVTHVFQEIAKMKGGMLRLSDYTLFEMGKEEPPTLPVPEGFWVGPLDPDLHTDFVEGRWKYSRKNSNVYIRELLEKFPSAGVFNKHDELVGCTLGNEYGTLAMGHIDEDYRRFGLCAHMVSSVARAYFRDGLPSHALTLPDNTPVKRCCVRSGLKELRLVHWMIYYKGDEQASIKELGF